MVIVESEQGFAMSNACEGLVVVRREKLKYQLLCASIKHQWLFRC
jgi:hypothetical protein